LIKLAANLNKECELDDEKKQNEVMSDGKEEVLIMQHVNY
jgi:hypothetical protein